MDSEGSLAAFTLLPHAFHTSSITGTIPTAIPHATADPATISPSPTGRINDDTDTVGTLSGIIVCSDGGSISVYTDVRTKGTPRVAGLGKEIVYQSSNSVKARLRSSTSICLGAFLGLSVVAQFGLH